MILSVKIKDETYKKYAEMDPNMPSRAVERQIERFQDVSTRDRSLLLDQSTLTALESSFGFPLTSAEDFKRLAKAAKTASLDGAEVEIPAEMRNRIIANSAFAGKPLSETIQEIILLALRAYLRV